MSKTARIMLKDNNINNIDDSLVNSLITEDAESTKTNIENFIKSYNKAVEDGINERLKLNTLEKIIYATASDNLCIAYAKVDGGEINRAFDFVTDETGIIGVTHDVDKTRLTAETTKLSASVLFAERTDGVVKITITEPKAK